MTDEDVFLTRLCAEAVDWFLLISTLSLLTSDLFSLWRVGQIDFHLCAAASPRLHMAAGALLSGRALIVTAALLSVPRSYCDSSRSLITVFYQQDLVGNGARFLAVLAPLHITST